MSKFLDLSTIVEEVIDWGGYSDFSPTTMKKWAGAVLRKLEAPGSQVDKIKLLTVENYKVKEPEDLEKIVQMAFYETSTQTIRRTEIVEWTQQMYDGSGCELVISKDCPKCHKEKDKPCGPCTCDSPEVIFDVDRMWEIAHPEFKYNHMKHYYRHGGLINDNQVLSPYCPQFVLMKPAEGPFFNADKYIPGCLNLNKALLCSCDIEYKIRDGHIEVNKEKGQILVSYLAPRLDSEGYRMIPDEEEVLEALKWYVIEAIEYRSIGKATTNQDRQHHKQMWKIANTEKKEAMGRAYEVLHTPEYEPWINFLDKYYMRMFREQTFNERFGGCVPDHYNNQMNRLTDHR